MKTGLCGITTLEVTILMRPDDVTLYPRTWEREAGRALEFEDSLILEIQPDHIGGGQGANSFKWSALSAFYGYFLKASLRHALLVQLECNSFALAPLVAFSVSLVGSTMLEI